MILCLPTESRTGY